jgi:hypothetical protein
VHWDTHILPPSAFANALLPDPGVRVRTQPGKVMKKLLPWEPPSPAAYPRRGRHGPLLRVTGSPSVGAAVPGGVPAPRTAQATGPGHGFASCSGLLLDTATRAEDGAGHWPGSRVRKLLRLLLDTARTRAPPSVGAAVPGGVPAPRTTQATGPGHGFASCYGLLLDTATRTRAPPSVGAAVPGGVPAPRTARATRPGPGFASCRGPLLDAAAGAQLPATGETLPSAPTSWMPPARS